MSRLYEISYDKSQWSIRGSRDTGYQIVNKRNFDSCVLHGDVIGIEQISDNEFLIYRRIMRDKWQIVRFKFDETNHTVYKSYCKNFSEFDFLTEDTIIFDKDSHVLGATLYHISSNTEDDSLNHLLSSEPDCRLIETRYIDLLYDNVENNKYPTALFVNYKFRSFPLNICAHLQVVLDVHTFAPITPAYSSLRDKYFDLNDSLTLGQIAKEDSYYAGFIGSYLSSLYSEDNTKTPDDLLNMAKEVKS